MMKITFLGGGNMANALIGGLRKQGYSATGIQVIEPLQENREKLTAAFGVRCSTTIDAAALDCDALILAVKPQQTREALAPLTGAFAGSLKTQLVISIADRHLALARRLSATGALHAEHPGADRCRHHWPVCR